MATNFAGNLAGFDAREHDPVTSFDPVPAGWYPVIITDSEFKPTKSGTGQYLQLVMEIIEGEHKGRKIFDRLNLDNPSPTAVKLAQSALSAICHAVGIMTPKDSTELHDRPFEVRVSVRPKTETHDASNAVKEYRGYSGAESASGNGGETAASAAPRAAKPAPWKRQ